MKLNIIIFTLIAGLIAGRPQILSAQDAVIITNAALENTPPPEDGAVPPPEDASEQLPASPADSSAVSAGGKSTNSASTAGATKTDVPEATESVPKTALESLPKKDSTVATVAASDMPATPVTPVTSATVTIAKIDALRNNLSKGKGLRMNFRGVSLETVLNYMSDAAGFIIHPKVDVHGKVDVWSAQPLTKDEAVKLLKQVLSENGYTAIQDGRTLTILRSEDARKDSIPVITGNNPQKMPKSTEIVTQIIPIRTLNAVRLVKDLESFKPTGSTLIADETANSLVMTDTQSNIRHITEIVSALDNVTSSTTSITNFALRYADAKSVASLLKDLFPNSDSSKNNGGGGGFGGGRFRGFGGGGFPGFGGGGGGGSDSSSENGHTPQIKVNAVSDDHSNTLLVTAPDDLLPTIAEIVTSLDQAVEDQTEVRVFSLKNADATEMAELLTSLFPDESANSSDATRSPFRFGPFGGFGQQQSASSQTSERAKKMSKVTAVADRRTSSVVVTAGKDMMPQIVAMVDELDKSRARKQSAHVIPLANADPVDVQTILQELFPTSSGSGSSRSGSSSSSSSQNNYLQNRAQTQLQQQNSTTTGSFGTSTGSSGSGRGF